MKIAFVVGEPFPTLSETFIINQITGLIDRGHDVDIYAGMPETHDRVHPDVEKYKLLKHTYYELIPENKFSRLKKAVRIILKNYQKNSITILQSFNVTKYPRQAASLRLLHQVAPHLNQKPYDIVHCHFGYNALKALLLRSFGLLQGKFITTFHGVDLTKHLQQQGYSLYNQLFKQGDLFLPISNNWKHKLLELGCDEQKIMVHHMGIDCRSFSYVPRQTNSNRTIRLVSISRLVEKKGLEYSIRAVAKLAETNPQIEYKIIGDGYLKEELQQLIAKLNVGNFVKLLGWQEKSTVLEVINNADVFLAPSVTSRNGDQEGIPVSLMEAMAVGLPVISTWHSGIPELVQNGVSGFLVGERDVDGLAEKLNYLIEHPEIRQKMGQGGRVYVKKNYDINHLNNSLVKIYQELLNHE